MLKIKNFTDFRFSPLGYFLIFSALAIFAWVRLQKVHLLEYWWIYPAHPLSANFWLWFLLILLLIGLITIYRWFDQSKVVRVLGFVIVFLIPIVLSFIVYSNIDWHSEFQRGHYNSTSLDYHQIFKEGHKSSARVLLENNNKFQENESVAIGNYNFSFSRGSISTHPPGHIIIYGQIGYLVKVLQERGLYLIRGSELAQGNIAFFYLLLSLLITLISTYLFAKKQTNSRYLSLISALAVSLTPTFFFFSARPDILVAAIFISIFASLGTIESKNKILNIAGIIFTSLLVFLLLMLTFGSICIFIGIFVYLIMRIIQHKISVRKAAWSFLIIIAISFGLIWLLNVVYGYNYIYNFSLAMEHQRIITQMWTRPYLDSLDYNIYETFPMYGIPIMILAIWSVVTKNKYWYLSALPLIIFAVIDFMGTSRGENARIWVFLAPLFTVAACAFLANLVQNKQRLTYLIIILSLFQILFFSYYYSVMAFPPSA